MTDFRTIINSTTARRATVHHDATFDRPALAPVSRRTASCRYCERYRRPCGREHTAATAGDWGRDWRGNTRRSA